MADWFLALPMPLVWLIVISGVFGYLCEKALPPLLEWWKYRDARRDRALLKKHEGERRDHA